MAGKTYKYNNITVSGRIATGTSTLAKNLERALGWKRINAGDIQREYDRKHGIHENKQGAQSRPDEHEKQMEQMAKEKLSKESNLIYEAWLSGFVARKIPGILRVLVICSEDAIRVDRVMNRDNVSLDEAKDFIQQREEENLTKWQKLYGKFNFWDPKYYNLVVDTYSSGPLETLGIILDKLGYEGSIKS